MKSEDISALIAYRMQRAEDSLNAARIMCDKGMFGFAMNRIYYAMFNVVNNVPQNPPYHPFLREATL
jgi:uncharacterized protein (UPF0332 family)